ncbi:hypothetical protein GCM10023237_00150 [Streptomyces coeruleoprunus]
MCLLREMIQVLAKTRMKQWRAGRGAASSSPSAPFTARPPAWPGSGRRSERALNVGAAAFRRVTSDPATVAAFDAEFGAPVSGAHAAPRAA